MSESKSDKKRKRTKASLVIMSRIDYEIARKVYELLPSAGISDEELSFLLGKPNPYFFALLNPAEKNKFKTAQLDSLPTILKTTIRKIVPNTILPGETVKLTGTSKTVYTDKIVYRYSVKYDDGNTLGPFELEKTLIRGERRQKNLFLHNTLIDLVNTGNLTQPKSALQIYLQLKENKELIFSPADLQKSLAVLSRKDGPEWVLKVDIMDGCYFYSEKTGGAIKNNQI